MIFVLSYLITSQDIKSLQNVGEKENSKWIIKNTPFVDDWIEDDYKILISCLKILLIQVA